jgi:AcrR family transcriptional regulator
MTNAPTSSPLASAHNPQASPTVGSMDGSNPGLPAKKVEPDLPDPSDEILVDQAGRPLGPRAIQTRRKILEATVGLLSEKPMRDMRVIDIARQIGSSPATFYQYFKDVEDVVLHLASQMKESTPELVELIGGDWTGRAGHERGCRISNLVIDHWVKYAPVLRARNNASDEGHMPLREERMAALLPLVEAFRLAIVRAQAEAAPVADDRHEWKGGSVDPLVGATALSSCLERLSMYHGWMVEMGGSREDLVATTATLMQSMLTVRR